MYRDENYEAEAVMKQAAMRDERLELMERFVGLDQARIQAENDREEAVSRLMKIREQMSELRHTLRNIVNEDADDLPKSGVATR